MDTMIIARADRTISYNVPPKKVLVVDDVPEVANTIEEVLNGLGHEVELSPNGKDALRRFKPGKYDLVITDYSMPQMNGVELATILKRRSSQQRIMMVTAFAFTITAYDGRPLPVDYLIHKPFKPNEIQDGLALLFAPRKKALPAHPLPGKRS